ncbi:hypothetical protein SNE40_006765 [Patella caerulea]|uniref:SOSS complex subunit C n=2 Tax=Patella caerulea TaxID=87958 RepID=A0AAN8JUU8_PATCE
MPIPIRMAFQSMGSAQEGRNRNILEQLEEEKKRLRMQAHGGGSSSLNSNVSNSVSLPSTTAKAAPVPTSPVLSTSGSQLVVETQLMTPQQRAALQHAHVNSVGYFITQESSFGNLILPVLPRFIEK